MRPEATQGFLALAVLSFVFLSPSPVSAQVRDQDLTRISAELARKIPKSERKKIAVFGFYGPGVKYTQLGLALGDSISVALSEAAPHLEVLDRQRLQEIAWTEGLPRPAILEPSAAELIGEAAGADLVSLGFVKVRSSQFELSLEVINLQTGKTIAKLKDRIPRTEEQKRMEGIILGSPLPAAAEAGKAGVGFPRCVYCPNPAYTEEARDRKVNGRILLRVLITRQGRAAYIQFVQSAGYGMDERAAETVRTWRFEPARGPDGKPVSVWTPVEINFRIY